MTHKNDPQCVLYLLSVDRYKPNNNTLWHFREMALWKVHRHRGRLFAQLLFFFENYTQVTYLSNSGDANISTSWSTFRNIANTNCPPNAKHTTGNIDTGFLSRFLHVKDSLFDAFMVLELKLKKIILFIFY